MDARHVKRGGKSGATFNTITIMSQGLKGMPIRVGWRFMALEIA